MSLSQNLTTANGVGFLKGCQVDRKRILIVTHRMSISTGNYRFITEDLADRLAGAGWSVICVSGKRNRLVRAADILLTVWQRRAEYEMAHIDVFSSNAFIWAAAAGQLLRWLGKPFTLTLHGGNLPAFSKRWPQSVRRLLQSASIVTAPSRFLKEAMSPYREDIRLLVNPLELASFTYTERHTPQPNLVWVRAFDYGYNPCLAARVVSQLVPEYPNIRLTMVGPDKDDGSFQAFQREVDALGIAAHVACVGGVPKTEVPHWLAQADVFLNTTNVDNTPVSLVEAMASGLLIVTTNVGGIPYLAEHEHNALLVPPDDPAAMAAAIRRILTDRALATHLSQNARTHALSFDWATVLPQWEAVFEALSAQRVSQTDRMAP